MTQARAFEAAKQFDQAIGTYRAYLVVHPNNDEVRASLARVLSWAGDHQEAVSLYEDILSRHPGDLDVRAALARIKSWQKKFAEAEQLYQGILFEAPKNLEAKRGLADLAYWSGQYAEALRRYEALQAAAPDPELAQRIQTVQNELAFSPRAPLGAPGRHPTLPFRDYLKVGYSHFTYTNQIPDERDWLVEMAKPIGPMTVVARVEPLNRFGKHDTPFSGELFTPLWEKAWGYIGGSGAVNPSFVPNWTFGGEMFQGLAPLHRALSFLEPSIGYRHMSFGTGDIDLVIPGVNIYLPYSVWLTEKIFYVPEAGSMTLASQLNWRPTPRIQLYASGSFGTSGERIVAVQDFTRVSSRTIQGGIIFPIGERLSAETQGFYEDRGTLYVRRGGSFNLIYHW